MANAPESSDSNFTWAHFAGVINKDLADVLGNFVNRVTKFCVARFEGKVPAGGQYGADEEALIAELDKRISQYTEYMEEREFRKSAGELRAIWVLGNEYLTKAAPWTHIKTDRAKAAWLYAQFVTSKTVDMTVKDFQTAIGLDKDPVGYVAAAAVLRMLVRKGVAKEVARLHLGNDRIGRKSMLVTTLMLMGVATFLIGLLPTFRL